MDFVSCKKGEIYLWLNWSLHTDSLRDGRSQVRILLRRDILFCPHQSITALGPTQSPLKRIPVFLRGMQRLEVSVDHPPSPAPRETTSRTTYLHRFCPSYGKLQGDIYIYLERMTMHEVNSTSQNDNRWILCKNHKDKTYIHSFIGQSRTSTPHKYQRR
jgi:hypothetical protein